MPDPMFDPFEVLGLPPLYDLDPADLERAYLRRAAEVHPDVVRHDTGAARLAAALNDARRVLQDPERRANALLVRLGGASRELERRLPEGFLAQMLATREEIEESLRSRDPTVRARWESWATQRRQEHQEEVARLFRALSQPPRPEELSAIRERLNAWRYIERLIEQLDPTYDPARADLAPP